MRKKHLKTQLLIGNSLGQFGSTILSFILGLYILRNLDSVFLYSLSQIIGPIVAVLLLPFLGSIIDKYNKNFIIKTSQTVSCIALLFFILSDTHITSHYTQIIVLLILLKISDQFLSTTLNAATIGLVEEENVQSFRSQLQLIQAASMILSPIIAVALFDKISLSSIMLIEFFIEFLVLVIYWKVEFHHKVKESSEDDSSILTMSKEGFQFIFRYKKIVFGLIFVLMINFILGIVNVGLPFLQIKELALSNQSYALNDSVLAFGLLLGSVIASKMSTKSNLNIARYAIAMVAFATCLLGLLLILHLSKSSWIAILIIYFLVIGLSITICNILISSWSILKIPQEFQGRVFAVLNALTQAFLPISMLLFGFLFDTMNVASIFTLSGLVLLLLLFVFPWIFKINLTNDELE